ncbi:hypothetical protein FOC1_g10014547 [Fusarium oxysporum f. sp. cubense race 1]|uniref:Uncharacterized protein n=1 Tax=Fusarium oxysporum f. sp. cubense (strain race 1) TaxID=1229664 RepID=N4U0Q3_FUSC1|nr:hypothetical protein FOC1_g10014547 [Fusarium oxysporum f. sp. cubense race 1]
MQTQSHLNNTRKGEYGFLKLRGRENEVSWDDFITIALYHRVNKLPASGLSSCETSESDDASSVSSTSDTSGSGTPIANVLPVKAPGFHVYVPIRTQTLILTRIQAILEHACFSFAQEAMPDILEETQWSCPEAGELNAWAFYFKKRWEILQQLSRCQLADCKKNIEQGLSTVSHEASMTRMELWAHEQQEMQEACKKFEKKRTAIFKKVQNLLLSREVACFTLEDNEDEDGEDDEEE